MAYSIRLPDGTLVRNIPDELSPEEAKARIIKAYPQYAPPSSALRQTADIPVQVGRGAVMGVRMLSDALGADNPVSQALRGAEDYLGDLLSAQAKKDQQEIARIMKDAEDKGILDQVKAGIEALTVAPVDLISQVLGTAAPTIVAGVAGAAAKLGAVGIGTLQAGTGAAMGAGLTKGNIYEVVKEELMAAKVPENIAEERAKAAQNYTGENWDQIILGGALGGAAALGPLERIFARLPAISPQVAAKNIFVRSATAGLAEAAPEAAQAFQEQVAQNIALQREGFDVPTFRGAVANATLEGLAGFGIGAPIGALEGKPQAKQPPGQQETEPTPPPAGVPPGAVIPEEEALTPEEEAEFQARLAAPPPPAPVAVQPQPQPPLPPAPAAVQPPVTPPTPPAPVEQVVEEEEVIEVPPTVEQIAQQAPVTPQTKSLTDQLAQVRAARMDPMLTPEDPAFQELDRREQEILSQIEQLSVQPGQLAPSVQVGQIPPPAEPSVQVGQLPTPEVITPPPAPVITPPPAQPIITPPPTPEIVEPEEPEVRTKDVVQSELNRMRQSLKKAKTAVKKKLMPESEVTKLEARIAELDEELGQAKAPRREVKYRSAKGNTWTGKGNPPKWMRDKLAAGYELSDFEIRPELGNKSEVEVELEKPPGFGRPMPATRPPEEYERLAARLERAEEGGPNLFDELTGKLTDEDVIDIGRGKEFSFLRAGKGKGKFLVDLIDDGELNEFLPDAMQPGSETYDAAKSEEYLKKLLRQDQSTDPEARITPEARDFLIPYLRFEISQLEAELEPEDVNQFIQEIVAEERAAIADLEAGAIEEQERGPAVPAVPAEFALEGQTPEQLAELQRRELSGEAEAERDRLEAEEAARAAAEAERKIADQKRETFELAPPPAAPTVRAAAPSGDLFGTAGITEQPTRAPRAVAAEPSPIEQMAEDARAAEEMGSPQQVLDELVKELGRGVGKRRIETPDATTILTEETWDGDTTIKRFEFDAIVSLANKTDTSRGAKYSIVIKETPTESITFSFQPMGLKPLDRRVDMKYVLSKATLDTEVPPLEDAINERMRQLGVADFEDASKKVQEAYGVSKPVADAYVRAVRKQAEAIAKSSYGKATENEFQEAYDEAEKLRKRMEGISKRKAPKAEAKKEEKQVKTEVITPSEDKYLGVNASGEKLYERKNGERYRMRMDRADRPSGYPDFGGDLAPVKDDVQTRTVYRTGPSFMDDLGPNVTAADVIRYEQEELGNQDLRVVTDADLSKIPTSKLEWVTFDRKDAEQYLPEDVDPEDTTEISSRKETFRILAQDSDGGYLIERVSAEAKPQVKKEKKLTGAYRLAIRQQNAADRFIDSVVEQFGLTTDQAQTALNRLLKEKVVSLDPVAGQFKLKDGRFWDKEVMRRAAGVEAEAEPEPKKKEKPKAEQFVRGTEEQLKKIKEFAKRYGGSEVAYYDPDKDIGMVLAFGKLDGDPKYIPYIKGIVGRTAFDISVAKFPEVLPYKAELLEVKERLEKAAEKKHQENPFIKFDRGIALSDGMDPKIEGIIREWKDMLGLGGINIYFSTTEDAKKNINNFTGPHRRIGSATIDANERGSMRRMEGGASYYVVFDKSTSTSKMLEVIAHEIGHVHEKAAFDRAPQELKDKLQAAHKKWLEGRKDKTSREAIEMLRAKTTAQTTGLGQTIETAEQLDKLGSYWSSFSEWYADQVSRWAVTDEKPVGVVEKFFARLGAALRRFYQTLRGQKFLPDETFVQYLKQVKPTIVETIPGPVKDPVNLDMSTKMLSDLFGSPKEAVDIKRIMEVYPPKKKLPAKRSPELAAAARALQAGELTAAEYDALVNIYRPIPYYFEPLKPATEEQVFGALDSAKKLKVNPTIPNGHKVGLRLDIPAFDRHGVFVVSIHQKRTPASTGKIIGYTSVAKAKNITFGIGNELKALDIAMGQGKDALQTMEGEYINITPEQAFAEAQRAIKDPNYIQAGFDPTRHSYFFDRRTTLPVVAAEEVIQIGNMILAKKPTFGSKSDFLYNIDSAPVQSAEDLAANRDSQNQQKVQDLKEMRPTKLDLPKKTQDYASSEEGQRIIAALNMTGEELERAIQKQYEGYTADNFMRRARKALDDGEISADVFAVVQSMYMADPKLLDGLRLDVKQKFTPEEIAQRRAEGKPSPMGAFAPFERVVYLYTGTKGVTDPMTIRHELTHTLEQLMTPAQRKALINAYIAALKKAVKKHKDAKSREFFDNVVKYLNDPSPVGRDAVNKSLPSLDLYQFTSPSEYWAVNAEKLMAQRLGTPWDRFKKAIRKMFEAMKKIFGFDNEFAVHDVFDKVISGSRKRMDGGMLGDFIGASNQEYEMIENTKEDAELVRRYQRPDTPMLDHSPVKRMMINGVSFAKEEFKNMAENPSDALRMMFNSLNRGVMYLRNKFVWFGSGINEADRIRYSGQVKTAEGLATASLALDNMLRGGNIATQTLFLGGVEFNDKTLQYTAVRKEKNMTKVYEAEAKIKERLGEQLGTNIIQGYLEAKRSRSIKNEVEFREMRVEFLNEQIQEAIADLKLMDADPKTTKEARAKADRELRKLFKEYRDEKISFENMKKLAEEKVTMSDIEIDDFIAREEAHPELREIIDNFNAVNQNLLRFWRNVGLLSEARYSALASIKDYVPWYRIMNDEEDVHSPLQATTRSATNIGREKLFRSGKPSVINDFIVEENQDVFRIQPSRVNAVKLNNVRLKPEDFEATANGEVRLKVDYKPGDVVVIETQREIENMIDNMTRNVMRMTMNGLRQYAAQRIVSEYATRDNKGQIMIFPKVDREKGRFDYIHDGRRYVVEIQDPLIAEAAYGMETVGMEMWKPLAAAANFTRRTITLSPVFQLKQVFKDAPTAALVTGVKRPDMLMGGVYKGFIDAVRDTDPAAGILRSAGIGGFYSPARTPEADVKRQIGIINNNTFDYVMKALDHWGDSSDMAQRIAIYNRVMKETGDEALAMYQASNVINFLRHGSGQLAQALVKTVPFLNAYAQSIDVLYNALIGGGLRGKDRAAALKQLAFTGSLLAGTAIIYTLLVGDDDDYKKLDDQTKVRNLIIPGTDVILPMNTSAAFFFKAIPELIVNKIINEGTANEVDAARLRTALKESAIDLLLGPTPIPSAVKPFIEISLDYNFFTSRPITPRGMENLDAYQQYDMRTSEAAKLLSGLTGTEANRLLNPMEADHLVRSIFGTAGAMVAWSSNVIGEGSAYRPEMTIKEFPVVGAFLRPEVPRGREDLFYRLKDATDRKYNTYMRLVERGDDAEADRYFKRHPNLISYYEYTTQMANDLKEINKVIRFIAEIKDPSYTAERKRAEIQELMVLKQDVLEGIEQFRKEAYAD